MLYQIPSDKRKRRLYNKYEFRKLCYKALMVDQRLDPRVGVALRLAVDKIGKRSNIGKIKNRCVLTGRGRSVHRLFGLDRFSFKKWANLGRLLGIEKTGW